MARPELVVLGGPNSGKTHFVGQLYGRVRRGNGRLKIRQDAGSPADLTLLEEVLDCLESGNAAPHTPTKTWAEVVLPLITRQGMAIDVRWPDYGGEQIKAITRERLVSEPWRKRLVMASGWLLLVRLSSEPTYPDRLAQLSVSRSRVAAQANPSTWDANARIVELLQILRHVAELGTANRLNSPRLMILLSCYDELTDPSGSPEAVLCERLPLVASFIEATWARASWSVWGLSSLGRLLESDTADESFIDNGPEAHGWVVSPEKNRSKDLSLPVAWLLETQ